MSPKKRAILNALIFLRDTTQAEKWTEHQIADAVQYGKKRSKSIVIAADFEMAVSTILNIINEV